jgi:GDP-mannose 6-dehydrogenase
MGTRISIFGLGYVGSTTAACLAKCGHEIIGVDSNPLKTETLNCGRSPIVEPGVEELVAEARGSGRLRTTTDANAAVAASDVSFVSVGTPSQRNGRVNLAYVERVCREIGAALRHKSDFHSIVIRSTVLPGTTESVLTPILEAVSYKRAGVDFAVCFNPEFLREGSALKDFFEPPLTILGASEASQLAPVREIYSWVQGQILETSTAAAEMMKYVSNVYHALKVAFANEIGTLCSQMGIDPLEVTRAFTADTKLNISAAYLRPGLAFGGSCLPKDVRALNFRARELDLSLPLLDSILPSNLEHIERAVAHILSSGCRRIGIVGLSFKAGTDDLRESPMVLIAKRLIGEGCQLQIWDEGVSLGRLIGSNRQFIHEAIPHIGCLLTSQLEDVISSAELVLLATKSVDKSRLASLMRGDQTLINLLHLSHLEHGNAADQLREAEVAPSNLPVVAEGEQAS